MENKNEEKISVIVEKGFEYDGNKFLRGWRGIIHKFILIDNVVNAIITYQGEYGNKGKRGFYVIPIKYFSYGADL